MSEWILQWLAFSKLIAVAVFGLLYGIGGMWRKWVRRFLAPILLGFFFWLFAKDFSFWYILSPALLIGALHKGYGGDDTQTKVKKRTICGGLLTITALPIAIVTGNWLMFGIHTLLCLTGMVVLGVWNPTRNARDEETLIGTLAVVMPMFMI